MATKKKPIIFGSIPEPENPRAAPGSFVIQGNAWYDEDGEMVIDEDGNVPFDIEWELLQFGNFLYDDADLRKDGRPRASAIPKYEMKWCPIARKPRKLRKR
jgi:hypothetical protein